MSFQHSNLHMSKAVQIYLFKNYIHCIGETFTSITALSYILNYACRIKHNKNSSTNSTGSDNINIANSTANVCSYLVEYIFWILNSLWPCIVIQRLSASKQNGRHFVSNLKMISWLKYVLFCFKFHWFFMCPVNHKAPSVKIIPWNRIVGTHLSETMMVWSTALHKRH